MSADPTPPQGDDNNSGLIYGHTRAEFWGMVGAVGTLVGIVIAIVFGVAQCSSGSTTPAKSEQPSRALESNRETSPPATPSTTGSASASSTSAAADADQIKWTGVMNMTYLNLDSDPPRILSSNTGASTWISYDHQSSDDFPAATLYGLGGGFFTTKPTLAQWTGSSAPTARQCAEAVSTQGSETLPFAPGNGYCVTTAQRRSAFITDLSRNDTTGTYTARVIVWGSK
ncbi:hypothetical protein [Nocardia sp. NPDC005366]|uniref:hypothetical protein n=1 Tax=Nocardia sp. NPDC005366 TaxID=3156878 RepID=UPI0033B79674